MHKDKKNLNNDSVIFSIGNHEGGGLEIFNDEKELIDIDTEEDFVFAEKLWRQ